ncbi:MAG: alpha-mannosidase [Oscillospiraceae bacterium]|nr:alpha-mannosidase [Oscillospiraceae bacterium]MBQ9939857.1 alpha-mannosidase [Oscillospiraceae bacterium]
MKKIHLIGNAHIDPVWLWRWQDGYAEVLATFRSALDRLKEDPEFKFTSACAVYYQWVEKSDPAMFEEIKERVREGRWNITGGWFLQPDCNIPTGESFARHALISQRYLKKTFGQIAKTGYNVDSFGHNASLPKILRGGGMENYVYMRPDQSEKNQSFDLFTWESDDKSRVTAYRNPDYYNINETNFERVHNVTDKTKNDSVPRMIFVGVGNHGGGPSAQLLDLIKQTQIPDSCFATVDEYFDSVDKSNLPSLQEELQHHARGCYSATSYVKTMNRRCEENLLAAERFSLLASKLANFSYPHTALNRAWKNLLFNQFHDILAGCAIESAYTDASYLYGETMSITEQAIHHALTAVCQLIDTGAGSEQGRKKAGNTRWLVWEHEKLGTPLVVFNPHAFPVKDTVTMRLYADKMTDENGNEIPFQLTRGEQTNAKNDIYVTTFPVEIPAMGYRVYRAFLDKTPENTFPSLIADDKTLENDYLRVEFDTTTGEIARIYDKKRGALLCENAMRTILTDETDCDTWAHNQFDLGEECAQFKTAEMKLVEYGPVCATLRVISRYNDSTITRFYTLKCNSEELFVFGEAELREKHRALKITFPARDQVECEIPYGTITRPLVNGEEPFGKWFASSGVCVANNNKHGYDSTNTEIRMTLLRSAIYADHYGFEIRDDRCRFAERGPQSFAYSISPYTTRADAHRKAAVLNLPLRAINTSFHHGPLPEVFEGFGMNSDNIIVTAIKCAEDHDSEAIIRLLEAEGKETDLQMTLLGSEIHTTVTPNSIKTVDESGNALNFMEWELEQ